MKAGGAVIMCLFHYRVEQRFHAHLQSHTCAPRDLSSTFAFVVFPSSKIKVTQIENLFLCVGKPLNGSGSLIPCSIPPRA